ncbi:uncharacterized protein At1g03900 [Durio zibethinus]|uniref:Uncharacterized protein At1g03900 n=1 Tax=Durio zibethinus TaxID=66656 RepID=A0A6P5ZD98_DURZI|nr:uncharacterized protein At1g03900 [Durio zibethinus]
MVNYLRENKNLEKGKESLLGYTRESKIKSGKYPLSPTEVFGSLALPCRVAKLSLRSYMMEKEKEPNAANEESKVGESDETEEALEIVLFHVSECYVYLIPPRKSAASYRADEWNVNKWAWEGALKVISKGEECIIRLEDKSTGELYARAFLRNGEPHPVEPVIDSSRYFVLRIEENIGGRLRHAFIGIGFRERTEAYDFQAALHDHLKYLNKKKTAEEMEQQFQRTSSFDYSLKEGQTLVLQIKNRGGSNVKSKVLEPGIDNLSLEDKGNRKEPILCIKPPPPPPAPLSPSASTQNSPTSSQPNLSLGGTSKDKASDSSKEHSDEQLSPESQSTQDIHDDDFGDFQTAE